MKSILQGLYDGEIFPDELIVPKGNPYRSVNNTIGTEKEYIKSKLSEEAYKRFEELDDLYRQSSSIEAEASFIYGFRLGAMLMIEVFAGEEKLMHSSDS